MHKQRTIRDELVIEGIGLHSGEHSHIRLIPAPANTGIIFFRADNGRHKIPLSPERVVSTQNNSALGINGDKILTVEHLLASLYGLGIDNLFVEVWGPEIPILDGSAREFVSKMLEVGIEKFNVPKKFVVVKKPIRVEEGDRYASLDPSPEFAVDFVISYQHPLLSYQRRRFRFSGASFEKEISPARTFGFLKDVEALRKAGLAKGGSLENVVVIGDDGVLNPEGLRFPDEPVRHKILDSLGDLMILGTHIVAEYRGYKAGHKLNHKLLCTLLSDPENYQIVEAGEPAYKKFFKIPRWLTPKSLTRHSKTA